MKKYAFGVDVGGTAIKMGFFNAAGELIDKWQFPTDLKDDGAGILDDIAEQITWKMEEQGISVDEVVGIGMGVPGPVTADGVVNKCPNLGWDIFNVEKTLEEKTGLDVRAGNDANVAALGEMWRGGGKGHKNMLLVTLGTGVGGGVIIDGKMLSGGMGAGGEIGHTFVDETEQECCGCGKRGCLEQYASATGIVRMTRKALADSEVHTALRTHSKLTSKHIFDAAKEGDVFAREQIEKMGKTLGVALANIACVINPEIIVIGGGVSKAGDIIIEVTEPHFKKHTFYACAQADIVLAELGNDAGIYGAAYLIMQE